MNEPQKDDLTPSGKDPAEGAPRGDGAPAVDAPQESHLGAAGDPVEGGEPEGG